MRRFCPKARGCGTGDLPHAGRAAHDRGRRPPMDLELEYNNRARVPDHAAHIAGWQRDAAAWRAACAGAELGLAYGPGEREKLDLFPGGPDAPLAVFIHGGYWKALDRGFASHCARGLNLRGVTVAV